MKKYIAIALVFLSACQKDVTDEVGSIDVNGDILYVSQRLINNFPIPQLFIMNADGTNQRLILDKPVGSYAISHSKRKIAFTNLINTDAYLYSMDIDGQNLKLLHQTKINCFDPVWSPDDSKITFVKRDSVPPNNGNIYTINADGTNLIQLTNQNNNTSPHYLPDNSGIIYGTDNGGVSHSGVYRMNVNGTNKQLLSPPGKSFWLSSVSPDGSMIAINSDDWNGSQIFVMKRDGSNLKQLTFTIQKNYTDTGSPRGGNNYPVWSPDNSRIAYISYENSSPDIYLINADGSGNKQLTESPRQDVLPVWTADGRHIVYVSQKIWYSGNTPTYGAFIISIMTADGKIKKELTDNKVGDLYPSFIQK